VYTYKKRFSSHRKSKLQPRGNGPFQVVESINDNVYKVDLSSEYGVNATFNVANLILFDLSFNLRSNPFHERDDDIDQSINIIKNILYVPYGSQGSQ
jgi:hypothetical protein